MKDYHINIFFSRDGGSGMVRSPDPFGIMPIIRLPPLSRRPAFRLRQSGLKTLNIAPGGRTHGAVPTLFPAPNSYLRTPNSQLPTPNYLAGRTLNLEL